ncbi:MAG: LCP family protein [Anaerolineales bacterium]
MLEAIKRSPVISGLVIFLILALNAVGWFLYFTWNAPLGPALDASTATLAKTAEPPTTTPEPGASDTQSSASTADLTATETPEPTQTFTPTVEPLCGGPPTMTILVSGVASEGYLSGLADAVRVVRVDFQTPKVSVLTLPRDLWVDIPGIADHGVTKGKLNQAYFYGTEVMGYFDGAGYGSGLLAHTLQSEFGLEVDHYIAVNLYAFRNIVDALGGVTVNLPEPVYTKWFGEPKLFKKAGRHHLTGEEAEKIVRARIEIGDYGRIQNQTLVLKALAVQMITPSGVKRLPEIVGRLINYTKTDLSPSDISKLICLAGEIDPQEDVVYEPVPKSMTRSEWVEDEYQGYMVYPLLYDEEEMRQLISDFEAGVWP